MPNRISMFLFAVLLPAIMSCSKNSTEPGTELQLSLAGVTCSEAWLALQSEPGQAVILFRNDNTEVFRGTPGRADTVFYDSGLLPAHDYTYHAEVVRDGNTFFVSQPLKVTTMDTSHHEFSIEVFSYGGKGSSMFYDVQIINPSNIWVAGEVYLEDTYTYDSLGNWIEPYNAAHWDGQGWELKRIPFIGQCSAVLYPPLQAVWALNENEIYFSNGGSLVYYDGVAFQMDCGMNALLEGAITKIWGTEANNLYVVGREGTIVHYNGQNWKKLQSHTSSPINDIWGTYNIKDDAYLILCTASISGSEKKLLQIHSDGSVTEIDWSSQNKNLHSVWFQDATNIFLCGGGVYVRNRLGEYTKFTELPAITTNSIRGQGINDIFVVGDFGVLAHYSGTSWRQYTYFDEVDIFRSIDYKEDLAVAVGIKNSRAIIYMLRKQLVSTFK